jgi:hypothetical protein
MLSHNVLLTLCRHVVDGREDYDHVKERLEKMKTRTKAATEMAKKNEMLDTEKMAKELLGQHGAAGEKASQKSKDTPSPHKAETKGATKDKDNAQKSAAKEQGGHKPEAKEHGKEGKAGAHSKAGAHGQAGGHSQADREKHDHA